MDNVHLLTEFIQSLLPESVVVEGAAIRESVSLGHPEEEAAIAHAAEKRKREFRTGRHCARKALKQLGIENFPLLSKDDRAPIWPEGVVGTLSHTHDYCVAAVVLEKRYGGIGLDIEEVERLRPELWKMVLTEGEQTWIQTQPEENRVKWAALIFSAKEAFYKYQYPSTQQWLGFLDAEIIVDVEASGFSVELKKDLRLSMVFSCKFGFWGDFVVSCIVG